MSELKHMCIMDSFSPLSIMDDYSPLETEISLTLFHPLYTNLENLIQTPMTIYNPAIKNSSIHGNVIRIEHEKGQNIKIDLKIEIKTNENDIIIKMYNQINTPLYYYFKADTDCAINKTISRLTQI